MSIKSLLYLMLAIGMVLLWGCTTPNAKHGHNRMPEQIRADISSLTDEVNDYLGMNLPQNTKAEDMINKMHTFHTRYLDLAAEASSARELNSDPSLDGIIALAIEGSAIITRITTAISVSAMGDAVWLASMANHLQVWAAYTDKVNYQGISADKDTMPRGHHYGWWNEPGWSKTP